MKTSGCPSNDGVALRHRDPPHDAAAWAMDHVLHLHRFHDQELLALADCVALAHVERSTIVPCIGARDRDGASGPSPVGAMPNAGAASRTGAARRGLRLAMVSTASGSLVSIFAPAGARCRSGSKYSRRWRRASRRRQLRDLAPPQSPCGRDGRRSRDASAASAEIRGWSRRPRSGTRTSAR